MTNLNYFWRTPTLIISSILCLAIYADPAIEDVWKTHTGSILLGCDASWKPEKKRVSIGKVYQDLTAAMEQQNPRRPDIVALETAKLNYIVLKCAKSLVSKNLGYKSNSAYGRSHIASEVDRLDKIGSQRCTVQNAECRLKAAFHEALGPVRDWITGRGPVENEALEDLGPVYDKRIGAEMVKARIAERAKRGVDQALQKNQFAPPPVNSPPDSADALGMN